jgi:hypothetical protein
MGFLLLCPQDLKGLISMNDAINVVEEGYRGITEFPVINAPRRRVHSPASNLASSLYCDLVSLETLKLPPFRNTAAKL